MKINGRALPLLILAILALVAGTWGGLLRIGWLLPVSKAELVAFHGPLMVCGFLGTVISLERAVALDKMWAYLSPALAGIGAAGIFLGLPLQVSQLLILIASVLMLVIFLFVLKIETTMHTAVMAAGVMCWITGNILWLAGFAFNNLVIWWMAFLLLTITGERLELSRLGNLSDTSRKLFVTAVAITFVGLFSSFFFRDTGFRVFGVGMLAFTFWLVNYDIARRTVKGKGITRFIAVCLLSGYFWLGLSGAVVLISGSELSGFLYDSFLHSFFLGFTFSMIFGHAPVIFPAVLKVQIVYFPRFYLHLFFLHISLLLRITGGLTGSAGLLKTGAMLNALTLILFLLNTVTSVKFAKFSISGKN